MGNQPLALVDTQIEGEVLTLAWAIHHIACKLQQRKLERVQMNCPLQLQISKSDCDYSHTLGTYHAQQFYAAAFDLTSVLLNTAV